MGRVKQLGEKTELSTTERGGTRSQLDTNCAHGFKCVAQEQILAFGIDPSALD